jgi:hypothetical protein
MNAKRRAALSRAKSLIEQAQEIVHEAGESERAFHDRMPESIQAVRGARRPTKSPPASKKPPTN